MPSALPAWKDVLRDGRLYVLIVLCVAAIALAYQRSEPFQLELGTHRDDYLMEGFYGPEGKSPNAVRWTGARADVRLPNLWPAQPVRLTLVLNAPWPDATAGIPVSVTVNGRMLGAPLLIGPGVSSRTFELDAATLGADGNLYVTLQAPTFTPRNDTRVLGVMLSHFEVTPTGQDPFLPAAPVLLTLTLVAALSHAWLLRLGTSRKAAFAVGVGLVILFTAGLFFARPVITLFNLRILYTLAVALLGSELTIRLGGFQFDRTACRRTALLFLGAFALRMVLAHSAGDPGNFIAFKLMIAQVAQKGVAHIYELDPVVGAYPPVHHYDWELISFVYRTFVSPDFNLDSTRLNFIMKMPTITLDMVITSVIMVYAARQRVSGPLHCRGAGRPGGQRDARAALLAGAAYALNPGIIYATAWNGQLGDPIYALWVTLGVVALLNGRAAVFGAAAALALLTKPQASAFLPFFAVAALRYLPRSAAARPAGASLARPFFSRKNGGRMGASYPHPQPLSLKRRGELAAIIIRRGARRRMSNSSESVRVWTRAAIGGAGAALLVLTPFLLAGTLGQMLNTVSTTIGHGPRISSNAYNIWWLLGWGRAWEIKDTELLFGVVSFRLVGLVLLFGIANGLLVWKGWNAKDRRAMLVLAVFGGLAFFMLPTEIHENYLFPTIPLLALATVHERGAWRAWAILSVSWFVNLVFVDTDLMDALSSAWPGFDAWIFPIQVGAGMLNVGVLVAWTRRVMKARATLGELQPRASLTSDPSP